MDSSQKLAIFDLDNTLLNGDSDHAWGEFLIANQLVNAEQHRLKNDSFYAEYLNGGLDIHDYLTFVLQYITNKSPAELAPLHRQFMQQMIKPMLQPRATRLLQQHREAGDYLLIITATNEFITGPIAKHLGVDDLLASQAEMIDGSYTGRPTGTPCFQGGKVTRLQQWLATHPFDLQTACFYSDSHNDIPLLEAVGRPVAVDADDRLLAHASKKGWQIMTLRD